MRMVWTSYPLDLNSDSARRRMTIVSSICFRKFVRSSRTKAVMARTFGLVFSGTDLCQNGNGAEQQQCERDALHFDLTRY